MADKLPAFGKSQPFSNATDKNSSKTSKNAKSSQLLPTNKMAPIPHHLVDKPPEETPENLDPETMTIKDVFRMVEKFRKMHDSVERQLDEIYQRTGLTPKEIQNFLSNPNNFTIEQWNQIQLEKKNYEESYKVKNSEGVSPIQSGTTVDKQATKERRAKSVSSRRHWIEVR